MRRFTLLGITLFSLVSLLLSAIPMQAHADSPLQFSTSKPSQIGNVPIPNNKTAPAETFSFNDATTIQFSINTTGTAQNNSIPVAISGNFTDSDVWDTNDTYSLGSGKCSSSIVEINPNSTQPNVGVVITLAVPDPFTGGSCVYASYPAIISDVAQNAQQYFKWTSASTMDSVQGGVTLGQDPKNAQHFTGSVGHDIDNRPCGKFQNGCKITSSFDIMVNADNQTATGTLKINANHNTLYGYKPLSASFNPATIGGNRSDTNPGAGSDTGDTGDGSSNAPELSCHAGFNPLNWLICGVIDGLVKIINSVDSFISSELSINTNQVFGNGSTGQSYYKAWSSFRDLALGLMVVAGLIVIICQALGFEILDAYTLRKVLPRLVVAAIAITVSWPLMQFFVTLTNDLGFGIRSLIYAPFSSLGPDSANLGGQVTGTGIVTSLGVTLATSAAIASLGIFGLLSFAGTAALAVFVAFLVLVIRQILITVLIILAPIAIVAYILPNTNKLFKLWYDSFAKGLMMFPLIAGFIAAGRVMSLVAQSSPGPFSQFIAFAAYFAPYFLLPLTFRFAGGALANIGGFVNDRHRGAFDGLKNFRGNQVKQRRAHAAQRLKQGSVFKYAEEGTRRDSINRGLQRATHLKQARFRRGQFGGSLESAVADTNFEGGLEAAEKLPGAKTFFASDDLMKAGVLGAGNYAKTFESLRAGGWTPEQAQIGASQALSLRSQMGSQAFDLAAAAKLPGTGTYATEESIGEWHQLIAKVSGGNKSLQASLISQGKSGFRAAQRYEVSEAGFGDHMEAVAMAERGSKTGDITDFIVDRALVGGGASAVVGARNDKSAKMFAEATRRMLQNAADSGDQGEQMRALAVVADIQDQMAGGKKLVTDVYAKEIFGFQPQPGGETILQRVNAVRDSAEFQQARRELGRDIDPAIRAAQVQQGQAQTPGSTPQPPVGGGLQPPL